MLVAAEEALAAVSRFLSSQRLSYQWHVLEREDSDATAADGGPRSFVAFFSLPTPTKPIPDAVARIYFRVFPLSTGGLRVEFKYENDNFIHDVARAEVRDELLRRIIERKRKLAADFDLSDAFDATRIVPEYKEDPGAVGRRPPTDHAVLELERTLVQLFQAADRRRVGVLAPQDLAALLRAAGLGLSEDEIIALTAQADQDADGWIQYAEFVPMVAELIQALRARHAAEMEAQAEDAEIDAAAVEALQQVRRRRRRARRSIRAPDSGTCSRSWRSSCVRWRSCWRRRPPRPVPSAHCRTTSCARHWSIRGAFVPTPPRRCAV